MNHHHHEPFHAQVYGCAWAGTGILWSVTTLTTLTVFRWGYLCPALHRPRMTFNLSMSLPWTLGQNGMRSSGLWMKLKKPLMTGHAPFTLHALMASALATSWPAFVPRLLLLMLLQ